eukprot:3936676-Rhodomonas_salina.4
MDVGRVGASVGDGADGVEPSRLAPQPRPPVPHPLGAFPSALLPLRGLDCLEWLGVCLREKQNQFQLTRTARAALSRAWYCQQLERCVVV